MSRNTLSRSLHDLGLSAWFGGTLANAVALNPAAAKADSPQGTGAVANEGWDRWTPVNGGAIALHLAGSVGQLVGNKGRITTQSGVPSMVVAKTALTAVALGVTAWSRSLGRTVSQAQAVPAESGTSPVGSTPRDVAEAQKRLRALQWAVPALTGGLVVISAFAGEQERASEQLGGLVDRLVPGR